MEDKIKSPVSGSANIELEVTFSTKLIADLYEQFGISVTHFFSGLDHISLYRCNDTDYRFYYPKNIFGDADFYARLQKKDANYYPENKWEYQHALQFIKSQQKILEIGCGEGHFLVKCRSIGAEVVGLEFNPGAVLKSKEKGLTVTEESIEAFSKHHAEVFDVVCAFQVLEHVYEAGRFLKDCITCLKPGGLLIIGVPHSNPYIYRYDKYHTLNLPPHHAGLWNEHSLQKIAPFFSLTVKEIKISPLEHYKDWFAVQKRALRKRNNLYRILEMIPRPIYKWVLHVFRHQIQGKTIVGVYQK